MNKELLKKGAPYFAALVIFILLAIIYCSPVLDGKEVRADDTLNWKGMSHELIEFHEKTGDYSRWTGSAFSGMPAYQISGHYDSNDYMQPLSVLVRLGFSGTLMYLILYFVGFFILLRAFKINVWVSIMGAVAIALSSYFFIILAAGHNTKAQAIAMFAPIIAGFFLIYNKKYWMGAIFMMVYVMLGFMLHPQMSYYFMMLIGCLFFAELYIHIKEKKMKDFAVATVIFVAALGVGLGTQYVKIATNREYLQETMRGGHSELTKETDEENKTGGLDLDYATQWSYGIDETLTLLIPNFKGGSTHYDVGENSHTYKALLENGVPRKNARDYAQHVPTYWGTQPFTSGPVYVGAIIVFLFVLGLCIVKGPYKWALLVATIFSILLSWGKNFMPLTELFFNYFPMYNKFRAISSILVVAEVTMPLLGFLAIKAIMEKQVTKEKLLINIYITAGITAGICLLVALFGPLFYDFNSPNDEQTFAQLPEWLGGAIIADRAPMLRADAFRSFVFILLAAGALWLFVKNKLKIGWAIGILGVLILADMWTVDKRFLNNDNFVTAKAQTSHFKKQPYEEYLLQDKDPNFRVLNLTTNTFNDSRTSYYFKSIGGYHAAKLRRYQDIIERHISKMNMNVINMLNTKYVIIPDNKKNPVPQLNPDAMGNAWFVDSLMVVNTPNEECDALDSLNLRKAAVVDASKFGDYIADFTPHHDSTAKVTFLSYKPNKLEYKTNATQEGLVVFSEVYYPYGWHAYIDDKPAEHFRVNYILRAMKVPAGEHHIRFVFDPDTIRKYEPISMICIAIVYLTIIGAIVWFFIQRKKQRKIVG
jgi:hypothetical protein